MKPLGDAIWHSRIQVLWILLSVAYAGVAKVRPSREASSVLIVLAGVLLVALLGHVLFQRSERETKSVLLVAFGSSVFLATISYQDLSDPLAASFAVAFSVMTGSLLFLALKSDVSQQLRYRYFVAIVLTVVGGALGYVTTIIGKALLAATVGLDGYYLVGAQGLASVGCFAIGLVIGPWVLPWEGRDEHLPATRIPIALPVAALCPAAVLVGLYWQRTERFFGSSAGAAVYVALESAACVALPVLLLLREHRKNWIHPWRWSALRVMIAGAVGTAVLMAAAVESLRNPFSFTRWLIRIAIALPAYLTLYASLIIGVIVASRGVVSARGSHPERKARTRRMFAMLKRKLRERAWREVTPFRRAARD